MSDTKKTLKINYVDFQYKFDPERHFFTNLLRTKYNVEISDNPDYIFYSNGGQKHHDYDCIRIFYTGENFIPNFNYCDYAIAFQYLTFGKRYLRMPLWFFYQSTLDKALDKTLIPNDKQALNRGFCATVISNAKQSDGMRENAYFKLSEYKPVASGGRWHNTMPDGKGVPDKIEFQRNYKFALAFENTYAEGYTTEKILEAFASHTVPIYYGDPLVVKDFNPKAFINAHDFKNLDELLAYVKKVDTDDTLYLKMLHENPFQPNTLKTYSKETLLKFFDDIFGIPKEQAKQRYFSKPYQDIDVHHIKTGDVKVILKNFILRPFKK